MRRPPPTIGAYDLLKIGLNVLGYLNKNDIDKNDIVIAASKRYVSDKKVNIGKSPIDDLLMSITKELVSLSKTNPKYIDFTKKYLDAVSRLYNLNKQSSFAYSNNVIESQIDGEFNGWEGETIVKLIDGSIWQQNDYAFSFSYSYCPKVYIFNSNGRMKMKVDGNNTTVSVELLK